MSKCGAVQKKKKKKKQQKTHKAGPNKGKDRIVEQPKVGVNNYVNQNRDRKEKRGGKGNQREPGSTKNKQIRKRKCPRNIKKTPINLEAM